MIRLILIIGTGSFLGGVARFLLARYIQNYAISSFPFGTFIVNVLGCFLIGIFYGLADKGNLLSTAMRLFLTVGFCGGFTTFSTFANENVALLRDRDILYFSLYAGLSVICGILAVYLGNLLIKLS